MDVRPALTQVVQSNSVPSQTRRQGALFGISSNAQNLISQISQTPGLNPNQRSNLLNLTAITETAVADTALRDSVLSQIQAAVVVVANSTQSQTPPFSNLTGIRFFDGFRTQAVGAESLSNAQVQQLVQSGLQTLQAPPSAAPVIATEQFVTQTAVPIAPPVPAAPAPTAPASETSVKAVAPISVDIEV